MSQQSPLTIVLTQVQEDVLTRYSRGTKTSHGQVVRARIILAAARGEPNAQIARTLHLHVDTVRKWRHRFSIEGIPGLNDRHRCGRPKTFTPIQVAGIKALACTPPQDTDLPLGRLSISEIQSMAVAEHLVEAISGTTIHRWLRRDVIKPWQYRSWIFPRDPDFGSKAARVLDLYQGYWDGCPLTCDDYVISADEKSQLQALRRRHAALAPAAGREQRIEFEYERGGTLAYFAAYDVQQARVLGRIEATTGIDPFMRLAAQVMGTEPYASAERVFWIVDNGSSHRGQASIDRMHSAWPNAVLVHLPVHASWLNQVEIFFSILQRKAIACTSFKDLDALADRVLNFQDYYNGTAEPFGWHYTKHDLNEYLKRLAAHEPVYAA